MRKSTTTAPTSTPFGSSTTTCSPTPGGVAIFGAGGGPAAGAGASPGHGRTSTQVASIGHTYVFSPTLVLDGNVGYQRMNQTVLGTDYGKDYSSTLGIPGTEWIRYPRQWISQRQLRLGTFTADRCTELDASLPYGRDLHNQSLAGLDERRPRGTVWFRPGAASPEPLAAGAKPGRSARLLRFQRLRDVEQRGDGNCVYRSANTTLMPSSCLGSQTTHRRASSTF